MIRREINNQIKPVMTMQYIVLFLIFIIIMWCVNCKIYNISENMGLIGLLFIIRKEMMLSLPILEKGADVLVLFSFIRLFKISKVY